MRPSVTRHRMKNTTPDEELDLDYCKEAVQMDVPYALSNSLGFGGHNASILLKKYSE